MPVARDSWFEDQPLAFQKAMLDIAHVRGVEAGEPVSFEGDSPDYILGVVEGCLGVFVASPDGEALLSHLFWAGQWVGEFALIRGEGRMIGTVARLQSQIALVSTAQVLQMLEQNPAWWRCFAQLAAQRTQLATNCAVELMLRQPRARCTAVLLRVMGTPTMHEIGNDRAFAPVKQEELARMTNLSRNSVGSILRELESEGLIDLRYGQIYVPSVRLLAASHGESLNAD